MNSKCYKVVFSEHLGTLVAVGEHTTSSGKAASGQGWRGEVTPPSFASLAADGCVGVLRLSFASVVLACLTFGNTHAQSSRPAVASHALPTGAVVNTGSASISANGAQMAITQISDKASLNWQSFNVGTGASVNIAQPSASSVLLNRVVGNDPSQILGKLTANGQVILLNPNGILFGKDGSVTASAFTASTFGLSDADFMNGYLKYNRNGSTASVVNKGTIETTSGGYVALIGASVSNEGTIRAHQGNVVLAAAESATFQNNVEAPSTNATVSVPLSAKVRLELTPAALNAAVSNSGVITTEGGQVLISAAALSDAVAQISARVTHSGVIDTSASQAGAVTLLADNGAIKVDGTITANSNGPTNDKPKVGGDIIIGRNTVTGVLAKSTDASGAMLESQSGFVETSGEHLKTDGIRVKANEWLLDPTNINIVAAGASGTAYAADYTAGTDSNILASDINANLNAGTSVTIATSAAGASAGTIAVNENISKTAGTDASLTLKAHGNIVMAGTSITSTVGKLNVVMNSDWAGSGSGAVLLTNASITSNGGAVTLGGGTAGTGLGSAFGNGVSFHGVWLTGSNIVSGAGNVTLTGTSNTTNTSAFGVLLENSSNITTTTGVVNTTGTSQTSNQFGYGLNIRTNSKITTGSGNITANGAGSTSAAGDAIGVQIDATGAFTTTSGNVSITGTSRGTGGTNNIGINFASGSVVAGGTGTVTLTGTASAVGAASVGVNNATVSATGAAINITGTASSGGASAYDITSGAISTTDGNITLTADSYNRINFPVTAGTGTVTLQNRTAGTLIDVGGADVLTGPTKTLGITDTELANFSAANVKIGSTTSGNFNVSAAITTTNNNVTFQSGGNVAGANNIAIAGINLTIDNAADGTLSGVISGSRFIKAGAGTLTLTGNNTYGNAASTSATTTINAGTLQVGNGGTSGTLGLGIVLNNGSLVFNRSDAISVANNIDGNGSLTQAGTGSITLSGDNIYQGNTFVNAGTLKAGVATLTSDSAYTVANGATLDLAGFSYAVGSLAGAGTVTNSGVTAATFTAGFNNTSTTFSGVIQNGTGTLSLRKLGPGTLTLSGNNTYSGTTTINTGTLKAGSSTAFSSNSALSVSGGATLDLAGNSNTLGSLAGAGRVTNSTVTSATLTTGGNTTSTTFSGVIQNGTGTLSLTKTGIGTTTLTGANTYSGTTTISAGILQVGNSGTTGTLGSGAVINDASLVFNRSNAITVTNTITGTGSFTQAGTGTTILTGSNAYGTTTISTGTLQVGNGGTTGTLGTGRVVDNANLVFARSVDTTIANDISGTGNVSATITSNAGTPGNLTVNSTNLSLTGGTIDLRADGNVTLSKPISTTNATSSAVKLVAGQAVSAGTSTGGNVIVNGTGAITVGTGGVAAIYSGSVAGTTGISGMAASGSGKFRYNSDETTTNFSQALVSKSAGNNGVHVVYRESPTLTIKVNEASKTYDGSGFSGGSFNATSTSGTLQNGDSVALIAGNATFAGTAQGKTNVADSGTTITASDTSGTNALGYAVSYTSGTLTVTKKDVSLSAITAANKTYDGNTTATITSGSVSTGVTGETLNVSGSGTFNDKYAADNKTVTVADVTALTKTNGTVGNWNNYTLTTTGALNTTANIAKATLSVSATAVTKTYDASTSATGTATVGALAGANDSISNAGTQTFLDKNVGTNKTVTASGVTIKDASNADMTGNYTITYVNNTTSVITKAPLVVTANADARFVTQADASAYKGVSYSGFMGGESSAVLGGALSISRTNALTNVAAGTYSGVLVPTGLTASNYDISYTAGNYTIVPADRLLVDTANQTVTYGTTPTYTTTAKYLDSRDNLIKVLTQTGTNNNYTFNDGVGTTISLALKPYTGTQVAAQSTSGSTVIGTYEVKDLAFAQTGTNFNGTPVFIGTVSTDPKAITPLATGVSKVYDGTTSMNNVVVGMSGKAGADLVSISGTGSFAQKNVGTNLGYTVTGISLSGADASNYYLSGGMNHLSGTNGAITPASLVLSTDNITKGYDGTVSATGTIKMVQGTRLFGSDSLSGGTLKFSSSAVGLNNKVVRVSDALINDGNEGRNYSVTYVDNTQSSIVGSSTPFVLPPLPSPDTVTSETGGNEFLSAITKNRGSTKSSPGNVEICKPILDIECVCTSSENAASDDDISCSSNPKSIEVKYSKISKI